MSSKGGSTTTTTSDHLLISKKWKNRDTTTTITSPGRTKIWTEPNSHKNTTTHSSSAAAASSSRKVPIVYYLSRNGQLEHPHFMEVPFSSTHGLYLKDVINRLNVLRGNGFASLYSWSSKRSYRNGFVWHDLSENDFIHPAHGQEYVLKGSELLEDPSINLKRVEKTTSFRAPENHKLSHDDNASDFSSRRRNQSWTSVDFNEYKVYKSETCDESSARRLAADVATQTDDKRRRRRQIREEKEEEEIVEDLRLHEEKTQQMCNTGDQSTELSRGEISPPPSDSSPETLETLMKADGPLSLNTNNQNTNDNDLNRTSENNFPSGRMKASAVLMQLISCGSISFRDCGPTTSNRDQGFSLTGTYKGPRLPRGGGVDNRVGTTKDIVSFPRVKLEDKEYFSGSLIETKKEEAPVGLKRSNSYNAGR
ncbi:hypothetical protein ACFE04_015808 [Oxalis oulophora]